MKLNKKAKVTKKIPRCAGLDNLARLGHNEKKLRHAGLPSQVVHLGFGIFF
jgi:hypothetical protein